MNYDQSGNLLVLSSAAPLVPQLLSTSINVSSSGDNTLITGAKGTIRVMMMLLVVNTAVNIQFKDGTGGTALTGVMNMLANGSLVLDMTSEPWFITSTGNNFVLNLSAAVQVSGRVYYAQG